MNDLRYKRVSQSFLQSQQGLAVATVWVCCRLLKNTHGKLKWTTESKLPPMAFLLWEIVIQQSFLERDFWVKAV